MAKYATYKQMQALLQVKEAFKGNSVTAVYQGSDYYIYSYSTVMAIVTAGGYKVINVTKYSRTTSKIQQMLKQVFPDADLVLIVKDAFTYKDNNKMRSCANRLLGGGVRFV